ncbi:LacI family transcriptional regulator [Vallitalea longa]|uniref:LacI family transcriptional regulator n=1 Tax=Vallitalea longa TaxID=2936439 RepID=A0A9W6DGI5_9FIRM|nr:LacI family DNA-binding transcriptional regulator [Vallitalea longa]GKX29794.1 LacI family transcriptional regulator [Vallitalea longa]
MVSIKDVAKKANVSISSVSNALNGRANVSEETRKRIVEIAKEMNYYPNTMARNLKVKRTKTVALCFSEFDRNFYFQIIKGINDCVVHNGYDLIICAHHSIEKFLRNGFIDGAMVLDKNVSDELILSAVSDELPIVVLDRELEGKNIYSVVVDNYRAMRDLVNELIVKGYTRFSYVSGVEHTQDNIERYEGMKDTLNEKGIEFISKNYYHGDFTEKSGYQSAKLMIISKNIPEVVICANDNMAIGVIKAFKESDIRIPEDVSVIGFDDIELANYLEPHLTTISTPKYEWGMYAATILFRILVEHEESIIPNKIQANIRWRQTSR